MSFIILIFVNLVRKSHKKDEAYLFQLGENQAFFSTNFGENIEKSFNKKYENFHEAAGFSSILEYHKMQNSKSHNKPFIEKISDCQLIDFIVIASTKFTYIQALIFSRKTRKRKLWKKYGSIY